MELPHWPPNRHRSVHRLLSGVGRKWGIFLTTGYRSCNRSANRTSGTAPNPAPARTQHRAQPRPAADDRM